MENSPPPRDLIERVEQLPYETIYTIFQYLPLREIMQCAGLSERLNDVSKDGRLYRQVNLHAHWPVTNTQAFTFLAERATLMNKLVMEWFSMPALIMEVNRAVEFIGRSAETLTYLSLDHTHVITDECVESIAKCAQLRHLHLGRVRPASCFAPLAHLRKLEVLNVASTRIDDDSLLGVITANPGLKRLALDHCRQLRGVDGILAYLADTHPELRSLSLWCVKRVSAHGVAALRRCTQLRTLDLGRTGGVDNWCLEPLAFNCDLRELLLTNWWGLGSGELDVIINNCPRLTLLVLTEVRLVPKETVEYALRKLQCLTFLDLTKCHKLEPCDVERWRNTYPNCTIRYGGVPW